MALSNAAAWYCHLDTVHCTTAFVPAVAGLDAAGNGDGLAQKLAGTRVEIKFDTTANTL